MNATPRTARERLERKLRNLAMARGLDAPDCRRILAGFDRDVAAMPMAEAADVERASDGFLADYAELLIELYKVEAALSAA
jgi:hypothetical protein